MHGTLTRLFRITQRLIQLGEQKVLIQLYKTGETENATININRKLNKSVELPEGQIDFRCYVNSPLHTKEWL